MKYFEQMLSPRNCFFLIVYGVTRNRYWVSRNFFFSLVLFVEVLRTDSEYQGAVFSHSVCSWKYSEQILSLVELFYQIVFVCGSTQNRFWVWWNCFFSSFYVEVLGTDFQFGGTVFSQFFCSWKCSEQILSFKELFFLIIFVRRSTGNRFWVSRNYFFWLFLFVEVLGPDFEFGGTVFSHFCM